MSSVIALAALFLISGPGVAFFVTLIGCAGANPLFGVFCGHNAYLLLIGISLAVWVGIGVFAAVRSAKKELQ